jgi:hypothetical protein
MPVTKSLRGSYIGTFTITSQGGKYPMAAQVKNGGGGFVVRISMGRGNNRLFGWRRFNADFTYQARLYTSSGLYSYSSGYWHNTASGIVVESYSTSGIGTFYEVVLVRQFSRMRFSIRTAYENGEGTVSVLRRIR